MCCTSVLTVLQNIGNVLVLRIFFVTQYWRAGVYNRKFPRLKNVNYKIVNITVKLSRVLEENKVQSEPRLRKGINDSRLDLFTVS